MAWFVEMIVQLRNRHFESHIDAPEALCSIPLLAKHWKESMYFMELPTWKWLTQINRITTAVKYVIYHQNE